MRLGDPVLDMRRGGLRPHQPVFELGDVAGDDFDRIAPAAFVLVGRKVQRLHDAAKDASGVVGVEDVEVLPQGRDFGGSAKLADRQAVECAEPIGRRVGAERSADAVRHLACGLIGECDGKHPMRRNAIDRDAARDGGGEGRGPAGPCPSQDQNGAVMSRGRDLGFCQGRGKRIERGGCLAGPFFEGNGRARHRFAGDRRPFVVSRVFGARITIEAGITVEVGIVEVRLLRHDRLSGMALHEGLARVRSSAFGMAAGAGTREQVRRIAP